MKISQSEREKLSFSLIMYIFGSKLKVMKSIQHQQQRETEKIYYVTLNKMFAVFLVSLFFLNIELEQIIV